LAPGHVAPIPALPHVAPTSIRSCSCRRIEGGFSLHDLVGRSRPAGAPGARITVIRMISSVIRPSVAYPLSVGTSPFVGVAQPVPSGARGADPGPCPYTMNDSLGHGLTSVCCPFF
jgi:hypothetical protein